MRKFQPPVLIGCLTRGSHDFEVAGGFLASIRENFVFDVLTLIEGAEASAFDRRDMNEHVLAATRRLNKTIAFCRVEPFHSTARHRRSPVMLAAVHYLKYEYQQ